MAEDEAFPSTMRSVEQDGFLEDTVVTPHTENTWRIISGHRRVMAARSDLSRATVERYLDLLNLDETMTAWAERGDMTTTDAYEMARQKDIHLQTVVEEYVAKNDAKGGLPGPEPPDHRLVQGRRASPSPAEAHSDCHPLRTVDSFGRAQLKAPDFSADVDKVTARKKLDTCLANLEELRRTVEALKTGLEV